MVGWCHITQAGLSFACDTFSYRLRGAAYSKQAVVNSNQWVSLLDSRKGRRLNRVGTSQARNPLSSPFEAKGRLSPVALMFGSRPLELDKRA